MVRAIKILCSHVLILAAVMVLPCRAQQYRGLREAGKALNPIIWADVPDMSVVRTGDTYYMSSTTMHMYPNVPIMKSKDLVNWEIVSYAIDILADSDAQNLDNCKNDYGRGTWASSLRFHNGMWYVSTFSHTTGKTYISSSTDIEKGPWKTVSFTPAFHDNTLFFDDDARVYIIYGAGTLKLIELNADASGVKEAARETVIIDNAGEPAGENLMLPAEGSQVFKVNGYYYLFNITWPRGGMRTVVIHRARSIYGPWEGRVALQDKGVAQGGLIDTPDGRWFAYLFRDCGSVGRIPYLVPVTWEDDWPILGVDGKVPDSLFLPVSRGLIPGIVASDEFSRRRGQLSFSPVWQWNHNPENTLWSVSHRRGWLRFTTSRIDSVFTQARNTLTQRTFGPVCSGRTMIDISGMKDGDFAGLALFQKKYGQVGVIVNGENVSVVMVNAGSGEPVVAAAVPVSQKRIYLMAECDFREQADLGYFYYSTDGRKWVAVGTPLKMEYSIPHFMGYRFGLFYYSTMKPGGSAGFSWFRVSDRISARQGR